MAKTLRLRLPDDVTDADIGRLRHELSRPEFWTALREKYKPIEAEWREVQAKWATPKSRGPV